MTDGGYYAWRAGVGEASTAAAGGVESAEKIKERRERPAGPKRLVFVYGPFQAGDKDSEGLPPDQTSMNKLGAWKVVTIPSGRGSDEPVITFVYGEDELERATVAMRQWLTFTVKYGSVVHGSILNDWKEVPEIKGLLDTDVSDLAQKMSNEQLQGFVSASGKKTPMIKKLYKRLHHDLKYPLSNKQASMIKVDPWPVKGGQLCAARQRLAFAKITELGFDTLNLIGESLRVRTQAGATQSQESLALLRRWACRSEGRSKMPDEIASLSHGEQPSAAAPGPAAAAEPDLGPPPIPSFKPPIPAPEPATPEPAQAQPPTARYVSVFEGDSSDSDQDGGGRKKTKRRKKRKTRKKRKKTQRK